MGALERRAVARLEYPPDLRPVLVAGGQGFKVVDCSERGLRYVAPEGGIPDIGTEISGRVHFASGAEGQIEGAIVRIDQGMVAVQFTGIWLSPELIDDERRLLRRLETASVDRRPPSSDADPAAPAR